MSFTREEGQQQKQKQIPQPRSHKNRGTGFGMTRDMNRTYCVYILANRSRTLYTGVTGRLEPRMVEHRQGHVPGFTTRYRIFRLVYFELFNDIRAAIAREKEIKGWRREKKIWLIKRNNPTWAGLAEKIPHQY